MVIKVLPKICTYMKRVCISTLRKVMRNSKISKEENLLQLFFIYRKKTIFEYLLGWFDQQVGFWKVENEYATKNLNPFNQEILKRIKNIENCICENDDK